MGWIYLALPAALIWLAILLLPWGPARVREVLDAHADAPPDTELSDVTVLIPARNEAASIATTLQALNGQGHGLKIVLVDDESTDATIEVARRTARHELRVITGRPLPTGWAGKLWALEQGRAQLDRPLTLLLDADIKLGAGMLVALRNKLQRDGYQFVSVMAALRMRNFWEKLLLPAFVFFFRLLYPFRLSNNPRHPHVAAAAGGCVLLETRLITDIGGFEALRGALIDDCTLARRVKAVGAKTWIGLTHSARSVRAYEGFSAIWDMVARSAFTQLHYSAAALFACTLILIVAYWLPVAGLLFPSVWAQYIAALALAAMITSYLPTLRFYGLAGTWALAMPVIGTLYLAVTWSSALRYWRGQRSHWKGRIYTKTLDSRQKS
ncbi:MAG: glycosyltransferase [Acidiferrobacterales bacterium]